MSGVLIFSARMGAGHEGAARELARRARARGQVTHIVDFLDAFPRPLADAWERFYRLQLCRWPESSYQMFYRYPSLWRPFMRFERALAGRRSIRWINDVSPDVIVSTYSFATLVLGRLVDEGRISAPTVAYLTDFGVHPRTVHPSITLHVAMHPTAAAQTRTYVPGRVEAPGPAVSPAYQDQRVPRDIARKELGLPADARIVLVVSGSWGIGHRLPDVVRALARDGRFYVIAACGHDVALLARLRSDGLGVALGWTEDMSLYIAGADAIVENAGGLTSLEAFAAGVPVISFDPIPGHGRDNVRTMVRAGVTTAPDTLEELCTAVAALTGDTVARTRQLAAADAMFARDPIDSILALIDSRRAGEP